MTKVCEYSSVEKSVLKILTLHLYCTDDFVKVEKIMYLQYFSIGNNNSSFQLVNPIKTVIIYLRIFFNLEQLNNDNNFVSCQIRIKILAKTSQRHYRR